MSGGKGYCAASKNHESYVFASMRLKAVTLMTGLVVEGIMPVSQFPALP